jgi:hypothetical protein
MSTTNRPPATIEALLARVGHDLAGTFDLMDIAEDEIGQAAVAQPQTGDRLHHAFGLLRPTSDLMANQVVYRGHVRELLARVVAGQDTRPGTAAEVCVAACRISQRVPLNTAAAGLYTRMWQHAFTGLDVPAMPNGEHYEALEGPAIDQLEAETRTRIGHPWRTLAEVTCRGRHHGVTVECRYTLPSAPGDPGETAA